MVAGGQLPSWATLPKDEAAALALLRKFHTQAVFEPASRYGEYLKSPGWRKRRAVVLTLAQGKCCDCGTQAFQVHHLTYDRIGNELLKDLFPKCRGCHEQDHQLRRDRMTHAEYDEEFGARLWWEKGTRPYGVDIT